MTRCTTRNIDLHTWFRYCLSWIGWRFSQILCPSNAHQFYLRLFCLLVTYVRCWLVGSIFFIGSKRSSPTNCGGRPTSKRAPWCPVGWCMAQYGSQKARLVLLASKANHTILNPVVAWSVTLPDDGVTCQPGYKSSTNCWHHISLGQLLVACQMDEQVHRS